MKSDRELVALAHENFVASFAKLVEHCPGGERRRLGAVFAYASGLPIALFNGCVVVEACTFDELDAALRWVRARAVPHRVFVAPSLAAGLAKVAQAHGLEREPTPYPGMVLHPVPGAPSSSPGVTVVSVDDARIEEFLRVGMCSGLPRDVAERLFSPAFLGDPDVHAFIGRLRGRPVGYAAAIRSEGANGVYNVGTLPEARRRGVGSALTWAAAASGLEAGLDTAVLQSSQMARTMYEAMGFRTVVRYAVFAEAARPIGHVTPVPPSPQ
jgi:GNAT superfamily N-acetyltransferase